MQLLAPVFLAGLGLLIVPLAIHLTQRRRREVDPFPSLMFLRRVPFRTSSRRRIRHPLLFALRCLGIVLIVLAFARPSVPREAAAAGGSARDVVLLLDTSASLRYGDRWERALAEARGVVDGLAEGDRIAIVSFTDRAEERLALSGSRAAAAAALAGLEPTDLPTRIEAGLQLAGRILASSDRGDRQVVLISDFQRTAWEDEGRARLPDGVTLRTVTLSDDEAPNAAVLDVRLVSGNGDRVRVVARVANLSNEPVGGLPVSLELNRRPVGTREVKVPARGAATVVFDDVPLPDGRSRGIVSIVGDGLGVDDALRFVAAPDPGLLVVLLEGSRGRPDRSLFLERALSLGEAPRVRPLRRPLARFDPAWLADAAAVILNDASLVDAGRASRLADWVGSGGALLVVLGPGSAPSRWAPEAKELLGGQVGDLRDRSSRGGVRLARLDYDHPVFQRFAAPHSGDFSGARFFRFYAFEPGEGTRVLARFEDGEAALLEHARGEGRVLVWTSTLDRFWNDLALQPVFLPFVHRMLVHATGYRETRLWVTAGETLELGALLAEAGGADPVAERLVLVDPDGGRGPVEISGGEAWTGFDRAGFYQVERLDGSGEPTVFAVNPAPAESDLATVAPESIAEAVVGGAVATAEDGSVVDPDGPGPDRVELWWVALALAALVLALESLIANLGSIRRAPLRRATGGR